MLHANRTRTPLQRWLLAAVVAASCVVAPAAPLEAQTCDVWADVVALDQVIVYNRLAAFNPAGMIFALAQDVFPKGTPPASQTWAQSCAKIAKALHDIEKPGRQAGLGVDFSQRQRRERRVL